MKILYIIKEEIEKMINRQCQIFTQYPDRFNILASQLPIQVNEVIPENNAHPIFIGMAMMWLLKTFPPNPDMELIVTAMYITFVVFSSAEASIHNTVDKYVAQGIEINEETEVTTRGSCEGVIAVLLFFGFRLIIKGIIHDYF